MGFAGAAEIVRGTVGTGVLGAGVLGAGALGGGDGAVVVGVVVVGVVVEVDVVVVGVVVVGAGFVDVVALMTPVSVSKLSATQGTGVRCEGLTRTSWSNCSEGRSHV